MEGDTKSQIKMLDVVPKETAQGIDLKNYLSGPSKPFFRAKNISGRSAKVLPKAFREVNLPNTGPTIIMDFNYKKEEYSLPLNRTNLKMLIKIQGGGLTLYPQKLIGKEITLYKVLVNNPKTNQEVEGIRIK